MSTEEIVEGNEEVNEDEDGIKGEDIAKLEVIKWTNACMYVASFINLI